MEEKYKRGDCGVYLEHGGSCGVWEGLIYKKSRRGGFVGHMPVTSNMWDVG
jgi:hypothetical protein